jgi:uncharacterized protein
MRPCGMRPSGMRHAAAAGLALAVLAAVVPARAATVLHLSATSTVTVMPDELHAELAATSSADSPVKAQAAVNAMMSVALATARATAGVTASTGPYSVWHATEPRDRWQASQMLVLTATDGTALLGLVGTLQGQGLAVSELGWQLGEKTATAAREKAEAIAVGKLKGRAEAVARLLGLHFAGFRQVWLTPPERLPIQPMALMAARAMPPPSAVPAETAVTATVQADAMLEAGTQP